MAGILDDLGPRAARRASPRFGVTLSAAGAVLVVAGAVVLGVDRLGEGGGGRVPGVVVSGAVVAGGYLVLNAHRTGPLGAAGVAASGLGILPFLFFLTWSDQRGPNVGAVLFFAVVVWLVSYRFHPARAHPLYLGLALIALWLFVMDAVGDSVLGLPIDLVVVEVDDPLGSETSFADQGSDADTFGLTSAAAAVGYLLAARVLDRRRLQGAATPFAFAGIVTTFAAISFLADDMGALLTGAVLVAVGATFAYLGATSGRRGTTWAGGAAVVAGCTTAVGELVDADFAAGVILIALGGGVVLLGHLAADRWNEAPETQLGPSRLVPSGGQPRGGSTQPADPPPPPAGSIRG